MEIKNLKAYVGEIVWATAYEQDAKRANASSHLAPTRVEIVNGEVDSWAGTRRIDIYKYLGGRGSIIKQYATNGRTYMRFFTSEQEAREAYNDACKVIDAKIERYIRQLNELRSKIEERRQEFGR